MSRGTFRFGSIDFSLIRFDELRGLVRDWAASPDAASLTITMTGAHGVAESRVSPDVQIAHDTADYVLCDGTPAYIAAVIRGQGGLVDRIPGIEAMYEIAAAAADLGLSQALIGGPPGMAERTRAGLESATGMTIIAETWSPPFVDAVDDAYAELVASRVRGLAGPAIVWIGLSTPKQELLAARLKTRLPGGFMFVAVGAAFDMYAGSMRRPPRVVSKLGLSWLFRVVLEPRRLAPRYVRAIPVVLGALAAAAGDRIRGALSGGRGERGHG